MKRLCLLAAAALILSAAFPTQSRAQFRLVSSVSIVPSSQSLPVFPGISAAKAPTTPGTPKKDSYVMLPSLLPNGTGQRQEKSLFALVVTNGLSPSQYPNVSLDCEAIDGTGGHVQAHHTERSGGPSIDLDGELNTSGGLMRQSEWLHGMTVRWKLEFKFTSPEPSGTHKITATVNGLTGFAHIVVEVGGLEPLSTSSSNIHWVGGTWAHPNGNSHYGTPTVNDALQTIANDWQAWFNGNDADGNPNAHPDDKFKGNDELWVNDMSLPDGGLFDIDGDWEKPHSSHREGKDVDIWTWRNTHPGIPSGGTAGYKGSGKDYLNDFNKIVNKYGGSAEYHPTPPRSNHIHIDF